MRIDTTVTQTGNDTYTFGTIATGLIADGKSGWQINRIEAFWVNGKTVAAADYEISAIITTTGTSTTFGNDDELVRTSWGLQNTAGVAVAVPYEPLKVFDLFEPRVTVQPYIYPAVVSSGTAQTNIMVISMFYDIVKLSDLEVLRLLAGGA